MRLIRFVVFGVTLALALAARNASAQSIQENLTFSILAQYEFTTNEVNANGDFTNSVYDSLHTILVGTHGVVKAIAVDLYGRDWTNWASASLLRVTNPTNGNEAIFMRVGDDLTNVSRFFGTSFSNNFTYDISNAFPALTNDIPTNYPIQLPIIRRQITNEASGVSITNTEQNGGMRFISLTTTNLVFNLLGVNLAALSNGRYTNVSARLDGVTYSNRVDTLLVSVVGSLYINTATNLFIAPIMPFAGPARGTFQTANVMFNHFPPP
jgi:hypothetical protein